MLTFDLFLLIAVSTKGSSPLFWIVVLSELLFLPSLFLPYLTNRIETESFGTMLAFPGIRAIPDKTQRSALRSEVKMEDRLNFPIQYGNAFSLAKRDADAIASLDVLSRLNRLTEERLQKQQLMEMAMMRQQEERLLAANQRSYVLGQLSSSVFQMGDDDFQSMMEVGSAPVQKQGRQKIQGKESTVNVQKVEAALRSQPQRGKKRTNLTKEERNELTRTRNREHARNTR